MPKYMVRTKWFITVYREYLVEAHDSDMAMELISEANFLGKRSKLGGMPTVFDEEEDMDEMQGVMEAYAY